MTFLRGFVCGLGVAVAGIAWLGAAIDRGTTWGGGK